MNNLVNITEEIKPEVIEELLELMGEEEVEAFRDYEEWMDNQIYGHLPEVFKPKRVNRRKYQKGKVIYTKCRIAGAIKKILQDSKGAKAHITNKRIRSFTGLSERTVTRYLYDVMDWMVREGMLCMEWEEGRGYYAWTQEWEDMVEAHGDLLEPKKFVRSHWLTKGQINFAKVLKRMATPPRQKMPPRTLKEDSLSEKPTSKDVNLNNRVPRALARLARNLLRKQPLPKFARIELSERHQEWMAAKLLTEGYWQKDVMNILNKALRIVDMSVADGLTSNPKAYLVGVISKIKAEVKPVTRHEIDNECKRFWTAEKDTFLDLMKAEGMTPHMESIRQFDLRIAAYTS